MLGVRPRESARWWAQPRLRRRFLGVQPPCSILQSYDAESLVYRHSSRNAMPTPIATNGQTKRLLSRVPVRSDSRNTRAAIKNNGPVIAQWKVRFLSQLAAQPIAMAKRHAAADGAW